ncbi:hypothetical protein J2T55_001951 [Methylohalomonas lacus]|uniref:Uncharacterized protein n=1 Tax=Methylohalomonas lacus TaxID=398773 RepID=A0AAE3HKI7_9GAMM|nr:hypothetical protein [Methylohalomonas lacus]MCS3903919.1 hypothetical protein [Methylohalomonas lacus]
MSFYDGSRDFFAFVVRAIGLILLLFGLWLALEVLNEAWQLYHEPQRIERFAEAIEQGSNIDRSIAPLQLEAPDRSGARGDELDRYGPDGAPTAQRDPASAAAEPQYRLSLSYYVAWVIALLLLLLLARIALGVVRTGGELVLYETQMKRFARELVRETVREETDKR